MAAPPVRPAAAVPRPALICLLRGFGYASGPLLAAALAWALIDRIRRPLWPIP